MNTLLKKYNLNLTETQGNDGIKIISDGKNITLEYETYPQKQRGYYLIQKELKKGNTAFEIHQKPHFDTCGIMLDLSFTGVMTVEAVCDYIDASASLGLNMLMLYMEDSYVLDGYPKFGYMRGRYTLDELKRIDDYAYDRGVEIIPAIQTMGHLGKYLQWGEVPAENATCLLPDNEKVFDFIEAEISFMRKAFRTKRIHVGMDETRGLGFGRSFKEHGLRNVLDIFNRHLKKVIEIAGKYDFETMIWADMYFSESDEADYYVDDAVIPQHAIDSAPASPELIFWSYYYKYRDYYDKKFEQYRRFPNKTGFAGGIWTMDGFIYNHRFTVDVSMPALESCLDYGIKTIIATTWGDECNYSLAKTGLALFSEYCYLGKDCTIEDIDTAGEYVSGEPAELQYALSKYYDGYDAAVKVGKGVFYSDLLLDTFCRDMDFARLCESYKDSLAVIEKYPHLENYSYYKAVFESAIIKTELMANLRDKYLAGDREYIKDAAENKIPALVEWCDNLYNEFIKLWDKTNKPFTKEIFPARFGAVVYRLKNIADILLNYAYGKTDVIEELDAERAKGINVTWKGTGFYLHM